MPGVCRCDLTNACALYHYLCTRGYRAHRTPGIPAPSVWRGRNEQAKPRAKHAARSRSCIMTHYVVIARSEATKQSSFLSWCSMDCFASLAMTIFKKAVAPSAVLARHSRPKDGAASAPPMTGRSSIPEMLAIDARCPSVLDTRRRAYDTSLLPEPPLQRPLPVGPKRQRSRSVPLPQCGNPVVPAALCQLQASAFTLQSPGAAAFRVFFIGPIDGFAAQLGDL